MAKFNFENWWMENVGPEDNVMDTVYKKIAIDAVNAALKSYNVNVTIESGSEDEQIDMAQIDLSEVLG